MQQDEVAEKVDYDEIVMNPLMAEIEAGVAGDADAKNKQRRYWTAKEEQCFFEIWGRDNWRLTRHGKNTIFFAQWAEEMKERFEIDITPGEVQAKVNQTRAKFRAVKKQANFDKNGPRWKKFDLIDRILKNRYRPKDAEPIPPELLIKNRDISPDIEDGVDDPAMNVQRSSSPTSLTSSSQETNTQQQQQQHAQSVIMSTEQHVDLNSSSLGEQDVSASLFNANELQPNPEYGSQLYNDVKQEFPTDYHHQTSYPTQYTNEQNHFTPSMVEEPPQLLELQTPQQQQQHHQQQMQHHQPQPPPQQPYNNVATATAVTYEHHSAPTNTTYTPSSADTVNIFNNTPHYSTATIAAAPQQQQQQQQAQQAYNNVPQQYGNSNYVTTNNGSTINNGTNNGVMQPPRPTTQAVAPRKRGRTPSTSNHALVAVNNSTSNDPALEIQYLDEVRKKNAILDEQKDIARKRLHLEERKVTLMEQFFPKFLEMQAKIMDRLPSIKVESPTE